jgi:hypothetical protein
MYHLFKGLHEYMTRFVNCIDTYASISYPVQERGVLGHHSGLGRRREDGM